MKKKLKLKVGQSLVEVVIAVGIVAMVVSGMVVLMTKSLGSKTSGFERKRAVELSEIVIENIVNEKTHDPSSFWNASSSFWTTKLGQSLQNPAYPNYSYTLEFTERSGGSCGPAGGQIDCADVKVTIFWQGGVESSTFTRFFSRY